MHKKKIAVVISLINRVFIISITAWIIYLNARGLFKFSVRYPIWDDNEKSLFERFSVLDYIFTPYVRV